MKTIKLSVLALTLICAGCVTRYTTVQVPATPIAAISINDVISESKAGVSDSTIINQINQSHARYPLSAENIISLSKDGVSQAVINALINTAHATPPPLETRTVKETTWYLPIFVEPVWYGDYYWGYPSYYHYHYH